MVFSPHSESAGRDAALPPIEWEEGNCPLCDGTNWTPKLEAADATSTGRLFLIVQCQDCGLSFTNPRPSARSLRRLYPVGFDLPETRAKDHWWQRGHPLDGLLPVQGRGRLLDVGGGALDLLRRLNDQGWQVTALHPSASAAERLRGEWGWPALVGGLPHAGLIEDGAFDAITFWHSLGQQPRPLDTLREAQRLLAPGGKLVVAAPNLDCLPFRWFGPDWLGLNVPRQFVHFTPWTLRLLLHRVGFRVPVLQTVRRSGWVRASARRFDRRLVQGSSWRQMLQGRTLSSLASWYGRLLRRADCVLAVAVRSEAR